MNFAKLESVSTDGLMKIQEAIEAILAQRLDRSIGRGRIAEFKDKNGIQRAIIIRRVNKDTVSGIETGTSPNPGGKWRVSKVSLKIRAKEIPGVKVRPFVPVHVPSTEVGDHW